MASCSAETANAEYTDKAPRHHHRGSGQPDLDHDKLPRKAVMLKDTEKGDKAAVLKVMVTLSEGQKTCPRCVTSRQRRQSAVGQLAGWAHFAQLRCHRGSNCKK